MTYQILQGDARTVLQTLPEKSVQCVVTSPPYYGLRDYGVNGQIGLEPTPEVYVENLVTVFREVHRVLKDDGTLWLNLGDSYAGSGGPGNQYDSKAGKSFKGEFKKYDNPNRKVTGLKPKDLIGIPWMGAFALRADGWYLRSEIIWNKPNSMPESVKDRPTKSHEHIFLLSKSSKYYYDSDAIAEDGVTKENRPDGIVRDRIYDCDSKQKKLRTQKANSFARTVKEEPPPGQPNQHRADREDVEYIGKRNKRDVWTINTKPYKGAHFAVFPPEVPEICILAGSKQGDVVLDPFNGSGTTGLVATGHGRNYIGIELNPEYITLSHNRIGGLLMEQS